MNKQIILLICFFSLQCIYAWKIVDFQICTPCTAFTKYSREIIKNNLQGFCQDMSQLKFWLLRLHFSAVDLKYCFEICMHCSLENLKSVFKTLYTCLILSSASLHIQSDQRITFLAHTYLEYTCYNMVVLCRWSSYSLYYLF